jgi:hypothetical protein
MIDPIGRFKKLIFLYLESQIDIHISAYDFKFPHHHNEITQAQGYYDGSLKINHVLNIGPLKIKPMVVWISTIKPWLSPGRMKKC